MSSFCRSWSRGFRNGRGREGGGSGWGRGGCSRLALLFRIVLLSLLVWLIGLTQVVVTVSGIAFSWRDIILIGGGLFLIAKATHEIHTEVEAGDNDNDNTPKPSAFFWVVIQIIIIDMVFSLDSIITAIGMAP